MLNHIMFLLSQRTSSEHDGRTFTEQNIHPAKSAEATIDNKVANEK